MVIFHTYKNKKSPSWSSQYPSELFKILRGSHSTKGDLIAFSSLLDRSFVSATCIVANNVVSRARLPGFEFWFCHFLY